MPIPRNHTIQIGVMHMAKTGPKTVEGIAAVTRNLPPPHASGPRTPQGKFIVSLNGVKHGLYCEFLPCKRSGCFYKEVCPLSSEDEGKQILQEISYGSPCPWEVAAYEMLYPAYLEDLAPKDEVREALVRELVILEIKLMRCSRLSVIECGLMRQVPVKDTPFSRTAPCLASRYRSYLWRRKVDLLQTLLTG